MAQVYAPTSLGIKPPAEGFQQGGWYNGRQYWGGTLSEPGVIHPSSNQVGSGAAVSPQVNAQSAAAQGITPTQMTSYLQGQTQKATGVAPTGQIQPSQTAGQPGTSGVSGAGAGAALSTMTPQVTLNLPQLYQNLYKSSGISDKEVQYATMESDYINAKAKINDNPFLSEATRVGRVAKLESLFAERTAAIKNEIAVKKADIETQLNLQTKQFDINSQAAQQALSQFNSLLQMGALSGASGEDIANLTRSTGISSDMIQSAISYQQKKDVKTQVISSTNDAGVVTVSVINTDTGEIVKQSSLGAIGNKQTGRQPTESDKKSYYQNALRQDAGRGVELTNMFKLYSGYLDPNEIYQLYNANSMYGPANETPEQLAKYGVKNTAKSGLTLQDILTAPAQ